MTVDILVKSFLFTPYVKVLHVPFIKLQFSILFFIQAIVN